MQKKIGVIQIADHIALERARQGFEDEIKKTNPDVEIISKNANGDLTVVPSIIKSFQDKKVDLIYAIATPAAQGAKNGEKVKRKFQLFLTQLLILKVQIFLKI